LLPIRGLTPKAKPRSSKALQLTDLAGAKRQPRSERRYSEQRSGSRVIRSDGKARLRAQCQRIGMFGPIDMDLERLVDELWCANHAFFFAHTWAGKTLPHLKEHLSMVKKLK
jgi:hypothetical protein